MLNIFRFKHKKSSSKPEVNESNGTDIGENTSSANTEQQENTPHQENNTGVVREQINAPHCGQNGQSSRLSIAVDGDNSEIASTTPVKVVNENHEGKGNWLRKFKANKPSKTHDGDAKKRESMGGNVRELGEGASVTRSKTADALYCDKPSVDSRQTLKQFEATKLTNYSEVDSKDAKNEHLKSNGRVLSTRLNGSQNELTKRYSDTAVHTEDLSIENLNSVEEISAPELRCSVSTMNPVDDIAQLDSVPDNVLSSIPDIEIRSNARLPCSNRSIIIGETLGTVTSRPITWSETLSTARNRSFATDQSPLLSLHRDPIHDHLYNEHSPDDRCSSLETSAHGLETTGIRQSASLDLGSQANRWTLTKELVKLSTHGWYWGPISREEAEEKLANLPDGSFLVRDSTDDRYLFSLSFRSTGRTFHTRVEYWNGKFSFYVQPRSDSYSSIAELIENSMIDSMSGTFCYSRSNAPGAQAFAVKLTKPVSRFSEVRSLQYMCRFVIRQHTRVDLIQNLPLPVSVKGWLKESQY